MTSTVSQATGYATPVPRSADRLVDQAYGVLQDTDDLVNGVEALEDARPDYDTAEEYYLGTREEFFATKAFRRALERTGTSFRLNYAKTPVDTVVERLEIIDIVGGDDVTRKVLQAIWEVNQMDIESRDINRRTCEFGDAYAVVWPTDESFGDPTDDDAGEDTDEAQEPPTVGIDIFYNDPRTMRAIYDEENPRKMKYVIKMWCARTKKGNEQYRANLYYKNRIEKYITKPGGKILDAKDWQKYKDPDEVEWPMANPFNRIPIFHFRNDRPYGVPEHKDAYGPQDAITKIVITQMTTMDYHSFPQRYALANEDIDQEDDEEDFGIGDEVENAQDSQASQIEADTGTSDLESSPGHLWLLRGIKGVGQFEVAGSDAFDTPFKTYVRAMAQVTRTPVHRFDESGNPPSGESLKVREQPFVKKVKDRQLALGATWNDLLGFIIEIIKKLSPDTLTTPPNQQQPDDTQTLDLQINEALPEGAQDDSADFNGSEFENDQGIPGKITVSWGNPSSTDDQLTWDIVILKRDAGVPARQALLEAGYSKKMLDEWGVPPSKWAKAPLTPPAPPAPGQPLPGQVDLPTKVPTELPSVRTNPTQTVGKLD
jgi:hypothetical protein